MPESQPVPFIPDQRSGLSPLSGASPLVLNAVIESGGAVRRRPGVRQHPSFVDAIIDSSGLDAVHLAQSGDVIAAGRLAANQRTLYRVTAGGSTGLGAGSGALFGMGRPVSAETEAMVLWAAGGPPQRILKDGWASARLPGSPPNMTHILAQGGRVLGNDAANLSYVQYSDLAAGSSTAGHEIWGDGNADAGFFSAEARPDPVVAAYENTNDVFVWGQSNVEVWSPDPQFVYSRAIVREFGLAAPYSVVKRDQSFAWLDHQRRIQWSDGREFEEISDPIQLQLNEMATVSDAFGYWVRLGPMDALVWTFPTDGRTFAYQVGLGWSQWDGHGITGSSGDVLATSAGRLGQLSFDAQDDLGAAVLLRMETGALNRGTERQKLCVALRLVVKADSGATSNDQRFWLQWRDEEGPWVDPVELHLSDGPAVELRTLGVYRKRRWRLIFSGAGPFTLAMAEEEFEVLAN